MHMKIKNPFVNSIFAEIYIVMVVCIMNLLKAPNTPDTPFDGMVFLSLFTLSAAVMGYLFIGEPLQLYLNGEKQRAVAFFIKTVAAFAVITVILVVLLRLLR